MSSRHLYATVFIIVGTIFLAAAPGMGQDKSRAYQTDIIKGEKTAGKQMGYVFDVRPHREKPHIFLLRKSPFCAEEVEEYVVKRNKGDDVLGVAATAAVPLALIFPRVGQPIVGAALDKSRDQKTESAGTVSTGKIVACGDPEPAPNEKVIIQSPDAGVVKQLQTSAEGILDVSPVTGAGSNGYINVFIDNGDSAFYVTTLFLNKNK